MEFLFGLDQLKRHQCLIDLKDNCLRIGENLHNSDVKYVVNRSLFYLARQYPDLLPV
jgi:hypothetical protein